MLQQLHKTYVGSQNAATSFGLLVCTVLGASKRKSLADECAFKGNGDPRPLCDETEIGVVREPAEIPPVRLSLIPGP